MHACNTDKHIKPPARELTSKGLDLFYNPPKCKYNTAIMKKVFLSRILSLSKTFFLVHRLVCPKWLLSSIHIVASTNHSLLDGVKSPTLKTPETVTQLYIRNTIRSVVLLILLAWRCTKGKHFTVHWQCWQNSGTQPSNKRTALSG